MFTIFIRNIDVVNSVKVQGTEFKAGQPLGHGRGKNSCSDPYIHVAMRKMSENGSSECSYVDPSSYVDNIKPFPKWQEECKEFVFKHIGNIIEAGLSGLGFEDIVEELSKRALAWAGAAAVQKIVSHFPKSKMAKMAGTMAFAYLSQHNSEIANVFMTPESQKALMEEKCEDMAKTTTSPTTPSTTKKTQDAEFSAGKQSVNKIMETLNADSTTTQKSIEEIQAVIERLKNSSTGIQLDDMSSMAFSKYGKILEKLNIPSKGSKQSMETTLQMLSWKVCPTFENGIAQGYGHFCVPSEDCFGLNCTIRIPHGLRKDKMSLAAHFDRVHSTFIIHTTNNRTTIVIDGSRKQFNITGIMSDYHVTILSHPKTLNTSLGQVYQLTLSAVVCDLDARCLPEIHIFHNLTFLRRLQQREIRSSDGCSFGADIGVENVGHIGGSIDVDKNGHVSGGGVDLGVNVGNVDINSGFQMNDQGEWGVNVGADVDLGDGNTVGTEMSLEGDGETLTFGLGVDAQFGDKGSVGGFIQGNTDGQLTAGVQGNVNTGAANVSVEGWIHHDKNGTSGGGSVAGNFGGKGHIEASVNRSANGAIDAGLKGGIKINNTTLTGGGFIHHDKNGTSGGAHIAANMNGKGEISASVNASSNGTIDAGISGSAQIGNSTISGAGYVHHDKNGTSGGGVVAANIDGKGHIAASLNASSDGSINAGVGGSAQIGNSTISGAGYVHHDKNGTSGGGVVDASIDGKGHIAASLNASSDGSIDAGVGGSAQIGNSTISGAGYVHHDKNGTSGGGVVAANIDGKGHLAASLNASSDGSIDAGVGGSAQIGNSTISGAGYVHHDQNGTSGGGMVDANVDGKGHIAASLNASSDGSIDAGVGGSAQIGNSTISELDTSIMTRMVQVEEVCSCKYRWVKDK
ncbi:uncharacterized protein LOC123540286 [Mercenaria mercenaria]|uniref:uncharacterized protein LOC123540286 n=1 Tax=Mercenaria mercenaria TaxID=6596 RepID=UPI00234F3E6C|nr:uncharacterized protein LOC123540286 [Mercenaria mercenaria]